jgi:hypothetical protein
MKTDEGVKYYIKDNQFIIPVFNNLIPVNKADKLDLNIYNVNDYYFLVEYMIYKKKSLIVYVYLSCMHCKK